MKKTPEFGGTLRFSDPRLEKQLRMRRDLDLEEKFLAAIRKSDIEGMKKCLEQGANIFYCKHRKEIPFRVAWQTESSDVIKLLLDRGMDPETLSFKVREEELKAYAELQNANLDLKQNEGKEAQNNPQNVVPSLPPKKDLMIEFLLHSALMEETLLPTAIQAHKKKTAIENLRLMILQGCDPDASFMVLNEADLTSFKINKRKEKYSLLDILESVYENLDPALKERGKVLREIVLAARSKWIAEHFTPLAELENALKNYKDSGVDPDIVDRDPLEIMSQFVPQKLLAKYQLVKRIPARSRTLLPGYQGKKVQHKRKPQAHPAQKSRTPHLKSKKTEKGGGTGTASGSGAGNSPKVAK
jgi:hypothetical protein